MATNRRLTKRQLSKIIAEEVRKVLLEVDIVNADTGEIIDFDPRDIPSKYASKIIRQQGSYDMLPDADFEALRKDMELNPDGSLDTLGDLAAGFADEVHGDLGTALDIAKGFKDSYRDEWKSAVQSQRIKQMYYDDDDLEFENVNDALARWLAERMS